MQGDRRLMYDYLSGGSCDLSYSLSDEARFRVNIFRQRGNFAVVLHRLQATVPASETLHLPGIFREIAKEKTGLVLVTGATGSGKTTTLAAMLNEINADEAVPHRDAGRSRLSSFIHYRQGTFNQRELGQDFNNYANGLRAALRQAPKVILVGEMRDRATVEVALMASETGHLVLSTLHTVDAGQIDPIVFSVCFTLGEEQQLRVRLSDVCATSSASVWRRKRAVVVSCSVGNHGKQFANQGSSRPRGDRASLHFYEIIEASSQLGWMTFDQYILSAFQNDLISEETAVFMPRAKAQPLPAGSISHSENARRERRTRIRSAHGRPNQRSSSRPWKRTICSCLKPAKAPRAGLRRSRAIPEDGSPAVDRSEVKSTWAFTKKMCCSSCALILMTSLSFTKTSRAQSRDQSILQKLVCESAAQRREQFVVARSSHLFPTNNSMAAFVHSVDHDC